MAGISLRSNIAALVAQRRLGEASDASARSFERLSSGFRINKASDDAAGLAIASSLNASRRVFTRGIQNLNDGLSLTNIADGAISQLSSVVIRIRELATQAANGTLSFRQRRSIDTEAQALADEFFRITRASEFNGLKLFDGTIQELRTQGGYGVDGSVVSNLGGALGSGTLSSATSYVQESSLSFDVALGDVNRDGILDMVTAGRVDALTHGEATVRLGNGDGTFGTSTAYIMETSPLGAGSFFSQEVELGDLNGDGNLDMVTSGQSVKIINSISYFVATTTVRLGNGNGTFGAATQYDRGATSGLATNSADMELGDVTGDGVLDIVQLTDDGTSSSATIWVGLGNGSFSLGQSYAQGNYADDQSLDLGDLNRDGILDIVSGGSNSTTIRLGNGNGTFGSSSTVSGLTYVSSLQLGDVNGDGVLDLVTAGSNNSGYPSYIDTPSLKIFLGNGNGTFGAATEYNDSGTSAGSLSLADINGDGVLDVVYGVVGGSTRIVTRVGRGNGTFGSATQYTTTGTITTASALGDLNGDGVLDLAVSKYTASDGMADIRLGNSIYGINPLLDFDLTSEAGALQSLGMLDRKLDQLNSQRGIIGALQSRLTSAVRTLGSRADNYAAAESRIKDTDISADAAQLVRSTILSQAASAVLAQANQLPAIALSLLQS